MQHRSHLAQGERLARSRLAKLLHQKPFLIGSLVSMPRKCGKPGCKCNQGQLHPGLYVALKAERKRKMIHIPQSLEGQMRQWIATYQEAWELMEQISQSCWEHFVQQKKQRQGPRP